MNYQSEVPWKKMDAFLLTCGSIRDPKEFCVYLIEGISALIPYDQARIYFVNDNGVVYDEFLIGVDRRWPRAYYEYYSKLDGGRYSLTRGQAGGSFSTKTKAIVHDWTNRKCDEFLSEYIKPQGIRYTFGFGLYDLSGSMKCTCILDRISLAKYSKKDICIMEHILGHLNNLYKNFYVDVPDEGCGENNIKSQSPLTARETEVLGLLSKGVSPANIGKKLFISQTTVYKHISHIHTKLNVSNRQELLVKTLTLGDSGTHKK